MSDLLGRFARIVSERRAWLNLTLDELQQAGGPSDVTTGRIERALISQPSVRTFKKLDVGLRWADGSAARTFAGDDPTPLRGAEDRRRAQSLSATTDNAAIIPLEVLQSMSEIVRRHQLIVDAMTAAQGVVELRQVHDELELLVDRILRSWLIERAEARAQPQSQLAMEPVFEMLVGSYLAGATGRQKSREDPDLDYLRWLVGRAPDIDDDVAVRFLARRNFRTSRTPRD